MMTEEERFLDPHPEYDFLDAFYARQKIVEALRRHRDRFHGIVLDVGSGRAPYRAIVSASMAGVDRYLEMDLACGKYGPHELEWDGRHMPFDDASTDCALATEVLEHCPEPAQVLSEIARVLRCGGFVLLTVPFLWPLHDSPHDEFRYTPFALQRMLTDAGFVEISIEPTGGWNAALAQMLGLWVCRAPMGHRRRWLLKRLIRPMMRRLYRRDHVVVGKWDQLMFPGLIVTAARQRRKRQTTR